MPAGRRKKNENLALSTVGSHFQGKKRITTYTRAGKMDSSNVKISLVVNESFEKK